MRHFSRSFTVRLGVLALVSAVLALGIVLPAAAQVLRTVKVELTPEMEELAIGPEIYVTRDDSRTLNYGTVLTRHLNNQRGLRASGPVIDLGVGGAPSWLLFSVENKTEHKSWILDFGGPSDGRYALVSRLLVRDDTKGETLLRALREDNHPREGVISGSSMMIPVEPGQTSLFVVYVEPAPGLSGTISPRLIRYDNALSGAYALKPLGTAALLLFFTIAGFYAALALARKSYGTLLFSIYYLLNAGLFLFYAYMFQSDITLNASLPALIMGLVLLSGLALTRSFLELGEEQDREKFSLFGAGVLVAAASGLCASGLFSDLGYSQLAFMGAAVLATGLMSLTAFVQVGRASYGAPHFAVGWLFTLGGVLSFALGSGGVLEPGPIVMNAYWISLLPQGFFFVAGQLKKIQTQEDQEQQAQIRQLREAQTISKLKQTKESADQSRLLRVIEREREVMAEMREKEMRRTEEMRVAMEHADEANRAKSAFLAVVSHEIRTPMTGIMGMVKLLQGTKLGSEQNDYVLAVQKSGDTMMALLNDILDFEKIESGNMELEHIDFDIHKLVGGVVTLMSGQATEKKIYLKSDIPEDIPKYVRGDPTRLRQVILNLVNNAIKFTESGGVTIHLRSTPINEKIGKIKADYEIYYAIEDTGIGISQEVQENLFSPFAQAAASTTRKYGGTGLGLAICKKLIEAMGSSIRVSSEEGAGSTFYFTLLMEEGRAELAEDLGDKKITPSDYETDPRHLLVVEDNEMNRRVFTGLLEKQGHRVVTSPSGEDALKKHEAMNFDLIISDVNMNGMSGMDLTRAIRAMADPVKAAIPVIALTGNVRPEDIKEFYEANMNGFLAKPIDPDKLALMIKKFSEGQLDHPVILQDGRKIEPEEHKEQIETNAFPPDVKPAELEIDSFEEATFEIATTARNDNPPPEPASDIDSILPPIEAFMEVEPAQPAAELPPPPADEPTIARYKSMFDFELLEQLSSSLGKSQFEGLINDYIEHADRIVAALSDARDMKDLKDIKARAHELKGMAANFGVQGVSKIAAQAEGFAAKSQGQEAVEILKDIEVLNKETNASLREWMDGKS
jgi:signal transduction histidine kinase/DNA-binding NarL/FixJ family response regulator/HPt (histidine-containing phosphotransfer) domain-containing protein